MLGRVFLPLCLGCALFVPTTFARCTGAPRETGGIIIVALAVLPYYMQGTKQKSENRPLVFSTQRTHGCRIQVGRYPGPRPGLARGRGFGHAVGEGAQVVSFDRYE